MPRNIADAKKFIKEEGHTTVPQLYYNSSDMLKGDSVHLTREILVERIANRLTEEWP